MSGIFTKVLHLPVQFPVVRGMISYALIWPSCSVVQEYLEHGTTLKNANWSRALRFSIFGTFFMAPVFYGWMKYSSRFFKKKDLVTAMTRAAVEQISYSPLAMAYFFFGMSLLEGKTLKMCVNEVREKFWPTYKIGVVFWPTAQTLNFYYISEKNRIIFVSAASFVWTVYLAHMKGKKQNTNVSAESPDSRLQMNLRHTSKNENATTYNDPLLVIKINSELSDQQPILEVQGKVEETDQILVVERDSDPVDKPPVLVSDKKPHSYKIVERQTEPAMEKKTPEAAPHTSSESAVNKKNT